MGLFDRAEAARRTAPAAVPVGNRFEPYEPFEPDSAPSAASASGPSPSPASEPARLSERMPHLASTGAPARVDALGRVKATAVAALFERLGTRLSDPDLDESTLLTLVMAELNTVVEETKVPLTASERQRLIREVQDDVLGLGPLQTLIDDPTITEVMVNGPDHVYIERDGKIVASSAFFADEVHLRRVIDRIVTKVGRRIDESSPLVDARLEDGSRVNAIIPPLAVSGSTLTIRKFSHEALSVADLIRLGTMSPEMAELLDACVRARLNIIVSGGTGTGKTTLLNVLSSFLPGDERIITIEDAVELQMQQEHIVRLEARPPNIEGKGEVTIRDLVRNALRMRPDRIVVGEVRGAEALDMLQAMNTGHDGSMSTVHANDTRETLDRLELMIALSGADLPSRIARQYISNAVDIVIHVTRLHTGHRRITRVSEVSGLKDGEYKMDDIFVYRINGEDKDGQPQGSFFATGYVPAALRRLAMTGVNVEQYRPLFEARELKME